MADNLKQNQEILFIAEIGDKLKIIIQKGINLSFGQACIIIKKTLIALLKYRKPAEVGICHK